MDKFIKKLKITWNVLTSKQYIVIVKDKTTIQVDTCASYELLSFSEDFINELKWKA